MSDRRGQTKPPVAIHLTVFAVLTMAFSWPVMLLIGAVHHWVDGHGAAPGYWVVVALIAGSAVVVEVAAAIYRRVRREVRQ